MNRRRDSSRTLTGSRIYIKHGSYFWFSPEPFVDPRTGVARKWHKLCREDEGELRARQRLAELRDTPTTAGRGDFPTWFGKWRNYVMIKRDEAAPRDPPRLKIWRDGSKALLSSFRIIEDAFADFDVVEVRPVDIAVFLDQWEGRRSAQAYKSHLMKFFAWCARKGLLDGNPAREVQVVAPRKRDVYITDDQYLKIRTALLTGDDGKATRTGPMVQCYMDLLYLLYQRGTDIRLLRWDDVHDDGIDFRPTKTERSSGARVRVPIGEDARAVFVALKTLRKMRSIYVIHTEHGQPYTAHGIGSLFDRACKRAGISGVTLKDIRAKAATDAKREGYGDQQIQTALAHTDGGTTRGYLRSRDIPVSEVVLRLPRER